MTDWNGMAAGMAAASAILAMAGAPALAFVPDLPAEGEVGAIGEIEALAAPRIIVKYVDAEADRFRSPAALERSAEMLSETAGAELRHVREMSGNAQIVEIVDAPRRSPEAADRAALAAEVAESLAARPDVEYAEVETLMQPQQAVDDPLYGQQWHYGDAEEGVDVETAWPRATGAGVVVSVIDTGVLPHADLAAKLLPGYDFIGDAFVGNDGDGREADASDPGDWREAGQCGPGTGARTSSWHGTHVAGTLAAVTDNAVGVAGVAPDARILPVRVLGRCGGRTGDIIDAVRWSAGLAVPGVPANANPAEVLNLSLGGPGACSAAFQDAIDDAVAAGATVVVAAGNSDRDAAGFSPASCDDAITVAATDRTGSRAFFGRPGSGSNFGAVVDVAAPGGETVPTASDGVLSTVDAGATTPQGDDYAFYQGTSMAAPHVAGVAALIHDAQPGIAPSRVLARIQATARPFPTVASRQCGTADCGAGIVDAGEAVGGAAPVETATTAWMRLLLRN